MNMKSTLVALLCLALSAKSIAQSVIADPAVLPVSITSTANASQDPSNLPLGTAVKLKIPVSNLNHTNTIPSGSLILKIGLGSKIILDPTFSLATAPLSQYFFWQSGFNAGQIEIVGSLIAPLPPDFAGIAEFRVIPNLLGSSTVSANILVTNHNTTILLSDDVPTNNSTTLPYTVVTGTGGPLPVNITKLNVAKKGCNINVNFLTESELNVARYEIETSRDGINFVKAGNIAAASRASYITDFALTDGISAATIFVRVKAIDLDGSYKYSEIKTVSGTCEKQLLFNIYPNPVVDKALSIKATSGLFNGRYQFVVMDMAGRIVHKKEALLQNATRYNYDLGGITAGKYILKVTLADGSSSAALPFEKL
jgi:hypothetical protein